MSEIAAAIAPEIMPPVPARKPRSKRPLDTPRKKRGPPRPYRKIAEDVLAKRIERLSKRIDRVKKQHESTRTLLTKYVHEKYYREKEAIEDDAPPNAPPAIDPLPL